MARLVKIGLVQMKMGQDAEKNLEAACGFVKKAAQKGAKIVCLPELFNAPYFAQYDGEKAKAQELAEEIPGKTTQALSQCARENRVVLIGGSIYEKAGNRYYNTSPVFAEDGRLIGTYRKTHIPHDPAYFEKSYFEPGDSGFKAFDAGICKLSVLICYDQWFPEAARAAALLGAEIIFYPTAIGRIRNVKQEEGNWQRAWENVMRGHAIANCVPVAAANRVGKEGDIEFWGGSFACDAFGKIVAAAGKKEEVLVCEIDLDHGKSIAEGWGFFKNRRPQAYGIITKQK